jgi:hypothetical protein
MKNENKPEIDESAAPVINEPNTNKRRYEDTNTDRRNRSDVKHIGKRLGKAFATSINEDGTIESSQHL